LGKGTGSLKGDSAGMLSRAKVFDKILQQIRQKISQRLYVMTLHAEEEMEDDGLSILDIEQSIFTGEILECQKDRNTGESKYRIKGSTLDGDLIEVVVKLGATGKVVIITVYLT
jgi:uncharacterized DUF497 family protein